MRKHTKVVYKKLKNYWGWADRKKNIIELSDKLKGKKHLEIIIHEKLHLQHWNIDEEYIKTYAKEIALLLWKEGYRKIV